MLTLDLQFAQQGVSRNVIFIHMKQGDLAFWSLFQTGISQDG